MIEDHREKGKFDWGKMALGILGGLVAVAGVALLVLATGGIAGAFLPFAVSGVVSTITTSAAIGAAVMGTVAVGSRAVADFKSGNVPDGIEYVKAGEHGAIVGAVTGAIGGGFEALSATWGLAATMTAMGVDGAVETWVQNTMDGVDTHWWDLVGAFGFSALSYGILDNLARSAKGPKPQNLDDLDDYAKRLEDINNRSYDDWLSDTMGKRGGKTGTVWDNITPTQENYPYTNIPKSFEIEVNGEKMWVHGNATEHMYEDVYKGITTGNGTAYTNPNLYTQEIMSDFYGSLQEATKSGIVYGEKITQGNWEFIFAQPRQAGQLPVIKHAQFNGWH